MRGAWRLTVSMVAAACVAAGCSGAGEGTGKGTPIDAGLDFGIWFPDGADPGGPSADSGGGADPGVGPEDAAAGDPGSSPTCPNGTACNDQDPCTFNDQCQGGVCAGTVIDCGGDDGLPCTFNGCQGGSCVSGVEQGFCAVAGACWSQGQANPTNPCQKCDPVADDDAWTSLTGGCDDGDDCTLLDECVAGQCVGVAVNCGDSDGNPCNDESCVGGVCQPVGNSGKACDDGDPCTAGETCSGTFCSGGTLPDVDNDGVAPVSCGGTDCNDNSAQAKPGLAEVCDDGLDNDCNGATDGGDAACGGGGGLAIGEPCQYHTDCYPGGACGIWFADGVARCSAFCSGAADCLGGQICSKIPGSANIGYCAAPVPGLLPDGSACTMGAQCTSLLCSEGVCSKPCLSEAYCPGSDTCGLVGDLAGGSVSSACNTNAALKSNGQACLSPDQSYYEGSFCASGHCDFMTYPVEPLLCAPICKTKTDCPTNQECNIVLYSSVPNAASVLFDPVVLTMDPAIQQPRDAALACFTSAAGVGSTPDGTVCSTNGQCSGTRCLPLKPGDDTRFCTRYCGSDFDCATPGMKCKMELTNMVSDFLLNFGDAEFPVQPGFWTYVRVCKFE